MWYVYIARCSDNSLYTGIAKDPDKRLLEHNTNNKLAARYTRSRRPLKLVYQESYRTRSDALKRECQLKQLDKHQKETLITQVKKSA